MPAWISAALLLALVPPFFVGVAAAQGHGEHGHGDAGHHRESPGHDGHEAVGPSHTSPAEHGHGQPAHGIPASGPPVEHEGDSSSYAFGRVPSTRDAFEVSRRDPLLVSGDAASITVADALDSLCRTVGWRVYYETPQLEQELAQRVVPIAVTGQRPSELARLIAVAGGADAQLDAPAAGTGGAAKLHVIRAPSASSDSGRIRLRQWAATWYRTFLSSKTLSDESARSDVVMASRMHLGELLMQLDDFEGAQRWFGGVRAADPAHPYVPTAMLREAQCHYELGLAVRDSAQRSRHLGRAEEVLQRLVQQSPDIKETADGVVLLGRVLIELGRYKECIGRLRDKAVKLALYPEIVDVYLLIGDAERRLADAESTLLATEQVYMLRDAVQFTRRQWLDFLFLEGWALTETGRSSDAEERLELFIGLGQGDTRRGQAFATLAQTYLDLGKYVEARSASIAARELLDGTADRHWRSVAARLDAKTRVATGDRDSALKELKAQLDRQSPVELETALAFYLIDEHISAGEYTNAIRVAEILTEDDVAKMYPHDSDRARLLKLRAMYEQARIGKTLDRFPALAIPHAERLLSAGYQSEAADLIGQAWQEIGEIDRAADAFRGVFRR